MRRLTDDERRQYLDPLEREELRRQNSDTSIMWSSPSASITIEMLLTALDMIQASERSPVAQVSTEVAAAAQRGIEKYGAMNSLHEVYAVLLEEVDELWDVVRLKRSDTQRIHMARAELLDVAVVAVRVLAQWEETQEVQA